MSRLEEDLQKLKVLAFRRFEYSSDDLVRFHQLLERNKKVAREALKVDLLRQWMLTPFSLWPFNVHDVFLECLQRLEQGKSLGGEMEDLLQVLAAPPSDEVCDLVTIHEKQVEVGLYEHQVNDPSKYEAVQRDLEGNLEFQQAWERIKKRWDVKTLAGRSGVMRRSAVVERNLRPDFHTRWNRAGDRFQAVFDAFCHRWNLYGMSGDQPLVMKLTVNLSAFGTMIFVPSYWSLDGKRDIRWGKELQKLHRLRSFARQGSKLNANREQRKRDAAIAHKASKVAKQQGLRGEKRIRLICEKLGWDVRTDPKRLRLLMKEFPDRKT